MARSSARLVKTGIMARRYSSLACRSEFESPTVVPAARAAASMVSDDSGFPASACSAPVRRVACELAPVRPIRADGRCRRHRERRSDANNREVRGALVQLGVGGGFHWLELHRRDDLVGRQIDREHALEEIAGFDHARPPGPLM